MKKNKKNLIRHTPVQRFWGVFVFSALFVCGIMVGLGLGRKSVMLSIEQEQIINPVPQVDVIITYRSYAIRNRHACKR